MTREKRARAMYEQDATPCMLRLLPWGALDTRTQDEYRRLADLEAQSLATVIPITREMAS